MFLVSTSVPASSIEPIALTIKIHANLTTLSNEAGWRCKGDLWSNLQDVCALLKIQFHSGNNSKEMLFQHVRYKAGQKIHKVGQHFENLAIVNCGFLKTGVIDEYGNDQVLNFPMKGDLLGIDGIYHQCHATEAVALSDCDIILLPYKIFSTLGHHYPELELAMFSVMSREMVRERTMASMLSALGAEAKVARFLSHLAMRFKELGYSDKTFNLRMTRHEIASYLGLAIETVSRTLSALHELEVIKVNQRQIIIIDALFLKTFRRLPSTRSRHKPIQMTDSDITMDLTSAISKKTSALKLKKTLMQQNQGLATTLN